MRVEGTPMRRHTPDAFDTAVQKGNIWLKDIEKAGKLRSRFQAYAVLRSVLHALRDCLPPAEAVKFSAQDGWLHISQLDEVHGRQRRRGHRAESDGDPTE